MAASGGGDQIALQSGQDRLTATDLLRRAWSAAQVVGDATALAYAGTNRPAFPIGLFAAAAAGVPFAPMNYRLNADQLHEHLVRLGRCEKWLWSPSNGLRPSRMRIQSTVVRS